ncbi:C39 family peptidase [Bacillus sp. ISL-45]|uniref:C39 family peptidase n=1 Tax=Bacillus sp. ISL-45 TaxID=2819128 RepID=UPI001BE5F36C|nr:C39 family peptidase [Bacillus sp. ISL-45]MBT2662870.1 C39 family peptidase [Bacillus sp. ISL-45]
MRKAILPLIIVLGGCTGADNPPPESDPAPNEKQQTEEENSNEKSKSEQNSQSKVMLDAPHISQLPELERGCEVTTLAMLSQHAGKDVGKMELSKEIARVPFKKDGMKGHPGEGFVGNMKSMDKPGLGVYHGPVAELGEQYLPGKILDLTGEDFKEVEKHVKDGRPVWVLVPSIFALVPDKHWEIWNTRKGKEKITYKWHSVLVTGFDDRNIYVNDPLEGKNEKLSKEEFVAGWEQFGEQAITYKP